MGAPLYQTFRMYEVTIKRYHLRVEQGARKFRRASIDKYAEGCIPEDVGRQL